MTKDIVNEGIQTVTLIGIRVTEVDYKTKEPLISKKGNPYKRVTIWTREYPDTRLGFLLTSEMHEWQIFNKINIEITIGGNNKDGDPYYNFKPVPKVVAKSIESYSTSPKEEFSETISNDAPEQIPF